MKNIVKAIPRAVIGGFAMCLLAFLSFNCMDMPLAPVAPMSDVKLEGVSLIDMTRTFADFLVKDKTLTRNPDGTSSYIKSESLTPQGIPPIKFMPQPSSQQVGVGTFNVPGIPGTTLDGTLAQMGLSPFDYPGANAVAPGLPPPFPASYVSLPGDTLNFSSQFGYIAIHSGTLTLQFTNNLPLRMGFNRPIVLRNNQFQPFVDTSVVAIFNFGIIDSFATNNSTSSLAGKILRGQIKFDSVSFTTQQRSTPFSLKSSNGISVRFSSNTLVADSASAVIPPTPIASIKDSVLIVDNLAVIQSAVFSKGKILLRLVNNLGIDVGVNLTVNEIKQNGTSYSINQSMTAKQTQDFPLDFSTISIQADTMRQYGTNVKFSVGITTLDSKGAKQVVTKNDFVRASFIPQDSLVVRSITGKITPTIVQINSGVSTGINGKDLESFSAQVILKGMKLTLNLPITGGFPTDYHLAFIAKNSKKNKIDSLQLISGSSSAFPRINPAAGVTVIRLSNPDVDLEGLMSKFFPDVPDSFFVRGSLTMDPPDIFAQTAVYSIYDTTKVYPSFDIDFPVALGIKNGVVKEVVAFGKQEIPKDFTKSVGQATLTFSFYNRLPFKLFFHANFLGNYNPQTHKGDTLLFITPSDTIQAAPVDNNGITTAARFSKSSISLNGPQMEQFNKADSLYIRLDMSTSNNGQAVRVRDTDYIRVYAKGDITYTVNKP